MPLASSPAGVLTGLDATPLAPGAWQLAELLLLVDPEPGPDPRLTLQEWLERESAPLGVLVEGDRWRLYPRGALLRPPLLEARSEDAALLRWLRAPAKEAHRARPSDARRALIEAARSAAAALRATGRTHEQARRGVLAGLVALVARAAGLSPWGALEDDVELACAALAELPLRWLGAEAVGSVCEALLAQSDARARQGSYYTPPALARTIARLALEGVVPEQARVLDPAVGCGPFLLAALDTLVEARLAAGEEPALSALRQASLGSLVGADQDAGALAVADLALRLHAAGDDGRCPPLPNLLAGDALLGEPRGDDEPPDHDLEAAQVRYREALRAGDAAGSETAAREIVARRQALAEQQAPALRARHGQAVAVVDWKRWFPADLARGGFDAVLGNPPYQRELSAKARFAAVRRAPLGQHARSRGDLWFFFSHLALDLLRPGGRHAFVVPAYWLKASGDGPAHLRRRLADETCWRALIDLGKLRVFAAHGDAGVAGRHVVFAVERGADPASVPVYRCAPGGSMLAVARAVREGASAPGVTRDLVQPASAWGERGEVLLDAALDAEGRRLLAKLQGGQLGPDWILSEGITANPEHLTRSAVARVLRERRVDLGQRGCRLGDPVFVVPAGWAKGRALTSIESARLIPWLAPAEVPRLRARATDAEARLLYLTHLDALDPEALPGLLEHLRPVRELLELRREVKRGKRRWFELHWPRRPGLVEGGRVLVPRMVRWPSGAWIDERAAVGESVYVLIPPQARWAPLVSALLNALPFALGPLLTAKQRGKGVDLSRAALSGCPWPEDPVFAAACELPQPSVGGWLGRDLDSVPGEPADWLALAGAAAARLAAEHAPACARHDGPWWEHVDAQAAALGELLDRAACRLLGLPYARLRALAEARLAST